jgi:hypothetical protein
MFTRLAGRAPAGQALNQLMTSGGAPVRAREADARYSVGGGVVELRIRPSARGAFPFVRRRRAVAAVFS